jgi:hypothetical protein
MVESLGFVVYGLESILKILKILKVLTVLKILNDP